MNKSGWRIAIWAGAAVAVVIIASLAVTAWIGGGRNVLTEDQVAQALADDSTAGSDPAAAPGGTGSITPTATPGGASPGGASSVGDMTRTAAGTVVVRCDGDLATLISWSPNPGYRADNVVRGPAAKASVWFESDVSNDIEVVATCANGTASVVEHVEVDDHGGGKGGSGSGGSGGSGGGGSGS